MISGVHSVSGCFCGSITVLFSLGHPTWVGITSVVKKKNTTSPTAECVSSKALCCVYVCAHTIWAPTYTNKKNSNSNRDVLTMHCHVYNSTSPGFSVMKKTLVLSEPLFSSGIWQPSTESTQLECALFLQQPLVTRLGHFSVHVWRSQKKLRSQKTLN